MLNLTSIEEVHDQEFPLRVGGGMTEYPIGRGQTWVPTGQLRWSRRTSDADEPELQQEWRCIETHAKEWRPVPVAGPDDAV